MLGLLRAPQKPVAAAAAAGAAAQRRRTRLPADLHAQGAAHRDRHQPPGRPGGRRRLPLGVQGARHGVRRGAPLPAGRRRAHDRLERHRPHGHARSSRSTSRSATSRSSWWSTSRAASRFGSRAILKRELAAEIAALLAFAALRNHDRVGAALVSDRLELFLAAAAPAQPRAAPGARDPRPPGARRHRPRAGPRTSVLADAQAALGAVLHLRLRRRPLHRGAQGRRGAARPDRGRDRRPARPGAAGGRAGGAARRRDRPLALVDGRRAGPPHREQPAPRARGARPR